MPSDVHIQHTCRWWFGLFKGAWGLVESFILLMPSVLPWAWQQAGHAVSALPHVISGRLGLGPGRWALACVIEVGHVEREGERQEEGKKRVMRRCCALSRRGLGPVMLPGLLVVASAVQGYEVLPK
jgi:hypothetical protein